MFTAFKGLKPFQLSEYIFIALFAFFVPISWRIASYVMIGLFVSCVLKGTFEKGFEKDNLQYRNKYAYIISIAFWALYAISFFYSENTAEARVQIGKKLPFLLFPIFFMTSNLSYLTKERVRTIMYCFIWGILTLFFVNLIWAGYDVLIEDKSIGRFYDPRLLKEGTGYIHHAYTSIYSCFGIAFCFYELFVKNSIGVKIFDVSSILMLILFIILSSSRAGLLCLVIVFAVLWFWIAFIRKEIRIGIAVAIVFVSVIITCFIFFDNSIARIRTTLSNLDNMERQDRRVGIMMGYKDLLIDKFMFGVGAGDRSDETLKSYLNKKEELIQNIKPVNDVYTEDFDESRRECLEIIDKKSYGTLNDNIFKYAKEMSDKYHCDYNSVRDNLATYINVNVAINDESNAHNQFSDTIIAVGILGLLLLLVFFFMPVYIWMKNKNFDIVLFSLLFIVAFNSLFESVLERQMGIMFFVFFYYLLFHANFCQHPQNNLQP